MNNLIAKYKFSFMRLLFMETGLKECGEQIFHRYINIPLITYGLLGIRKNRHIRNRTAFHGSGKCFIPFLFSMQEDLLPPIEEYIQMVFPFRCKWIIHLGRLFKAYPGMKMGHMRNDPV